MSNVGMVHWHEGLFLQPHHLQALQREVNESLSRERRGTNPFPYGVIDMKWSSDSLENMLVRVDRLRAIMPSGIEIDVPGNADLPALDVKRVFQAASGGFTIGLAVPLWQSSRANTVEPMAPNAAAARRAVGEEARVKRMYRVTEGSRLDENTGENPQPVLVRRYNARLVVEGDDTSDMEVIPLLRVEASASEPTLPRVDPRFVPPCLVLSGSPTLRNIVRDLAQGVEASRKVMVNGLARGGWVVENIKGQTVLDLFRLRTLNKWSARLPALLGAGPAGVGLMTPFEAYLELRELLGDLAALSPDRDPFEAPKYDHESPGLVFLELDKRIRPLLTGEVKTKVRSKPFVRDGTILSLNLDDADFTEPNGYFLGIRTRMDPTLLAKLVEDADKFKLMPKSLAPKSYLFGIKLGEERHPPQGMFSAGDLHYFRLVLADSEQMWKRVQDPKERGLGIRWPESEPFEYQDVQLYMTLPS
ncbi:MAG: type VI secretion system baseplate subunit TssK [Phycisphaerales bacterium]